MPTRRALLGASLAGVAGGAALLTGCDDEPDVAPAAEPGSAPTGTAEAFPTEYAVPDFDPADWASVRAQFPLDPASAQFAAFVLSPHTAQVDAAVDFHRRRLAFDTEGTLLASVDLERRVQAAAAAYAGGGPDDYALTDSTTMGLALVYGGLSLRPGDEVLTTGHDFIATERCLDLLARRTGASVVRVDLYDDPAVATVDEMVDRLVRAVTPRTRVVAITWVHSGTGVRTPVREIADALAGRALLCVDGVHGLGAVDVGLPELGCDFLTAGTHKWLFGPRGTGIVWARDWTPLTEIIPPFNGERGGARLTPGGYHSFEHRWSLQEAFAFHQRIGRTAVAARTAEQATRLKEALADAPGVTVRTPADPAVSAGIVCLDVAGQAPANAVQALRERQVVASATPYRTSYLRLGPSIVTTPEEVDVAAEAVRGLV